jgi:hypothetical protein
MQPVIKQSGFTLIETIVYIGLFALIFTGIFASIYPLITGAQRLTQNVATEGETAFILAKIEYALSATITDTQGVVTTPAEGATSDELILTDETGERFHFVEANDDCSTAPLSCVLTLSTDEGTAQPLNASRVVIKDFAVKHVAPSGGAPRHLEVTFTTGDEPDDVVGPVRYYLHF